MGVFAKDIIFVAEKDLKLEFIRVRSFYKRGPQLSTVVVPNDEEIQISHRVGTFFDCACFFDLGNVSCTRVPNFAPGVKVSNSSNVKISDPALGILIFLHRKHFP